MQNLDHLTTPNPPLAQSRRDVRVSLAFFDPDLHWVTI